MLVQFSISRREGVEEFVLPISDATWERHAQLSARTPRLDFWHAETSDARFRGDFTAMIVEPA